MGVGNKGRFKERSKEISNGKKIKIFFIKFWGIIFSAIFSKKKDNVIINRDINNDNIISNSTANEKKDIHTNIVKDIDKGNIIDNSFSTNNSIKIDNKGNSFSTNNSSNYIDDGIDIDKNIDKDVSIENSSKDKDLSSLLENLSMKFNKAFIDMELIEGDLYILGKVNNNNSLIKDNEEYLKEIRNIIDKIDDLKDRFNYLKKDYDIEYLIRTNRDNIITSDIISLNSIFALDNKKDLVNKYNLFDLYIKLYNKVEEVESKVVVLNKEANKQKEELKKKNIDFDNLKREVFSKEKRSKDYDDFIKRQDSIIEDINNKIGKIDKYETVKYRFKGYNELINNYFRYSMLFMISPLRGLFPSIGKDMLITKSTIKVLNDNLGIEKVTSFKYKTEDFSSLIDSSIYNLNFVSNIIDDNLSDILRFKDKYINEFKDSDNKEYKDILNKINSIEKKIVFNKKRIDYLKSKFKSAKKENAKQLKLVSKLQKNN